MAHLLELPNLREGYVELCQYVLRNGSPSKPRDLQTRELEDVTFTVGDLQNTLPIDCNRGVSTTVAAVEALQLIGGVSTPDLLVAASKNFAQFREPDGSFYGAYGRRAGVAQTRAVIDKLRADRDSRQAMIMMWDPRLDNEPGHRDYPCTLALGFRLRHDRLNLSVTMRSNDAWWGTAYDVFQFTQLQWTIANVLGVSIGSYTHTAMSLHLYERDFAVVEKLHAAPWQQRDRIPLGCRTTQNAGKLLGMSAMSSWQADWTPSERWYAERIQKLMLRMT